MTGTPKMSRRIREAIYRLFRLTPASALPAPTRALTWVRTHESRTGGIIPRAGLVEGGNSVTGALLPTIFLYGERELGIRCVHWLLSRQETNGAYHGSKRRPSRLASSYALQGLLAAPEMPAQVLEAARRTSEYLCGQLVNLSAPHAQSSTSLAPDQDYLIMLSALYTAANVLHEQKYLDSVEMALEHTIQNNVGITESSHLLGHAVTALIELNQLDRARVILDQVRERQDATGAITAEPNVSWVSSTCLAQFAFCWYRLGQCEPADKALGCLEEHQRPSGGFLGSYGSGASYFSDFELAWPIKWYLDAHRLRVQSAMARYPLPSTVSVNDGRLQSVVRFVKPEDRVIEVGCGKGRFLKAIREIHPGVNCTGVDIAPSLLAEMPSEISRREGSLECVPYPDDIFDVAFSIEAIEHSANWEAAIRELSRITRPGGWVLVIDKQRSQWGRLECLSWETWPDAKYFARLLEKYCDEVSYEPVGYDNALANGLMVVWRGRKRSSQTSEIA